MPEFIPEHLPDDMDDFTRGYLSCAEWLLDDDTERDALQGWHASALKDARADCEAFQETWGEELARYCGIMGDARGYSAMERAGHDFYLTRCGHGAGFWDRGTDPVFEALTKAAETFPDSGAYVGDDCFIYFA